MSESQVSSVWGCASSVLSLGLIGIVCLSGSAPRNRLDETSYRTESHSINRAQSEWHGWMMGVRKVDGHSPADPTAPWCNRMLAALAEAGDELMFELEEEQFPAVDPNGDPLVWPQLDAHRQRLTRSVALRTPFFRGESDLLAVLRSELVNCDPPTTELIARARQYAEDVDAALRACKAREREFQASLPEITTPTIAAHLATQGDPGLLPTARREHEQRYLPMHFEAVKLYRVHAEFARDILNLLPESHRESWRLNAALDLLRPYHDYHGLTALRARVEASGVIPESSKEQIRNLLTSRAPARAAIVERLHALQQSFMTESGVKEWWADEFARTIGLIMKSTDVPPELPPAWRAAMDELLTHDRDTRNRIQKLLTPEQWRAVQR